MSPTKAKSPVIAAIGWSRRSAVRDQERQVPGVWPGVWSA